MLVSCSAPTDEEIAKQKRICDINGQVVHIWDSPSYNLWCQSKDNEVMECIRKYNTSIENKYNNPDTVSDLREDNYSNVVKTCNEVFGKK